MTGKIDKIINKISEIRAFTDDSYLKTTHFAVFLLFGYSDELRETLERRAREIIVDKKAIAFLSADGGRDITADVRAARGAVSRSGVDLRDLNELHFCPLIISDSADPRRFESVVDSLDTYRRENDLRVLWKPFIILNTEKPSASEWLDVIARAISAPGGPEFCRCCVMTRADEDGFEVSDARLLDTTLFVALLHANSDASGGIAQLIAYRASAPGALFYTAQTVFLSNPVIMRTLRCMNMLLGLIDARGGPERDPDMSFAWRILEQLFARLPREYGYISFAPLYGVMPPADGDAEEFLYRLRDFARKNYLEQFELNKTDIFAKFRDGFLRAFIASGKPVDFLREIIGDSREIQKLSNTMVSFQTVALPPLSRKSGMDPGNAEIYADMENRLRAKLNSLGSELLEEFFESEYFGSLPGLCGEARKIIKNVSDELAGEVERHKRFGAEIFFEHIDDTDDDLAAAAAKELTAQSTFPRCVVDIALALERNDRNGIDEALSRLFDSLYTSVKGLSGGSGAQKYMDSLSNACRDNFSVSAKQCVTTVGAQLKFPIRFNSADKRKNTFVWGSRENNFYSAWEKQQTLIDTDNEFLPINSKERFVLLSVSPAFSRGDIRGIAGTRTPPAVPDRPPATDIEVPQPEQSPDTDIEVPPAAGDKPAAEWKAPADIP